MKKWSPILKSMKKFGLATVSLFLVTMFSTSWMSEAADSPVEGGINRNFQRILRHRLFPNREADEALIAQAHGDLPKPALDQLLRGASEDYFSEMDRGITQTANQAALQTTLEPFFPGITASDAAERAARGRNLWMVWTGGNDRFWNYMGRATFGGFDLLKIISDEPHLSAKRGNRWKFLGVVNEPCFEKAKGPRADRWGLWLDQRSAGCSADPFEDALKYPGIRIGARGANLKYKGETRKLEVGSIYGYATGVVGLRLFPNPDFDQKAASKWDAKRYYQDPTYFNDPSLVRPYRVGMACAFCHVGPSPVQPPTDFENPLWKNLSSTVGAQYFWVDRVFVWDHKNSEDNFVYQLLHTSRPGALDTSLVSSDQINNPRTMNGVYNLAARVAVTEKLNHREHLVKAELLNNQFTRMDTAMVPMTSPLRNMYDAKTSTVLSPRVLKDGSDSVGALGALNRVFINIGLFSEEWMQNFIPLIGGVKGLPISPIKIATLEKRSLYWQATVNQTPDLALFLVAASQPDYLRTAPQGATFLKDPVDPAVIAGKKVFADNCAQCHSSKLPEKAYTYFKGNGCVGENYLGCWNSYYSYTQTSAFRSEMEKIVAAPDFLEQNYLSTELRVPANLTDSQLCSPIATNAVKGSVWDNFSSDSYKRLPGVGKFTVNFPTVSGSMMANETITVPAGGRGYLRPASLISLWSTAPFLQNNSLGKFDDRGTVEGRMTSFNDSIQKLLNPELRGQDAEAGQRVMTYTTTFGDELPGIVDVTTADSYLKIPKGYLPRKVFNFLKKAIDADPVASGGILTHTYAFTEIPNHDSSELLARAVIKKPSQPDGKVPSALAVDRPYQRALDEVWGSDLNLDRKLASTAAPEPTSPAEADATANYPDDEMSEYLRLGPIPAGVPVNLIANIGLEGDGEKLSRAIFALVRGVVKVRKEKLRGQAATESFMADTLAPLLAVSTCKDFVVNRGHYFGTQYSPENKKDGKPGLSAEEKGNLIEFLKHL